MSAPTECVELTPSLLSAAATLLADYTAGWMAATPDACATALGRLLDFPYARFILARQHEVYCGFVSLQWGFTTTKGMPILRIQDVFVSPDYRRRGVARALLAYAAEVGRRGGAQRLQLETDTENSAGRELYESFGFEHIPGKELYMFFL